LTVPAFNIDPWADPKTVCVKNKNHRFKMGCGKTIKKKLDRPIKKIKINENRRNGHWQ
jgi:hypothetical protein